MHLQPRRTAAAGDGGFSLVEVVVAMALLVALGVSLLTFFSRSSALSQSLVRKQAAVALADEAMELVRSVDATSTAPAGSRLVAGRSAAAVDAQWASAPADVVAALGQTQRVSDPSAGATSTPAVPLRRTATVSGQPFTVDVYLGSCQRPGPLGSLLSTSCSSSSLGVAMIRAVVTVSWSEGAGTSCAGAACRFVLSSLVDITPDALFMINGGSVGGALGVAVADAATVRSGQQVQINVKSNDLGTLDPANPVTGVTPVGAVLPVPGTFRGTVQLGGASVGAVTYWAAATTLTYTDTFRYTLKDAAGRTSHGLVTITVLP